MPEASAATDKATGAGVQRPTRPARKPGLLDVEAGRKELGTKDILEIERATALTWGGRAAASYELAAGERDPKERFRRLQEGENYRQEAIEHAAMTEDLEFLVAVRREIDAVRKTVPTD